MNYRLKNALSKCEVNENGEEIRNAVTPITRTRTSRHTSGRTSEAASSVSSSSFHPIVPRTCVATDNCFVALLPQPFDFRPPAAQYDAVATSSIGEMDCNVRTMKSDEAVNGHFISNSFAVHRRVRAGQDEQSEQTSPKRARRNAMATQVQHLRRPSDELDDTEAASVADGYAKNDDEEPSGNGCFDGSRLKAGRNETKRRSHSEIERKRRSRINSSIESLARLVIASDVQARESFGASGSPIPSSAKGPPVLLRQDDEDEEATLQRVIAKWSKVDILARAYELLERLARENEEGRVAVANLRAENDRLRTLIGAGHVGNGDNQSRTNGGRLLSRLDALSNDESS